MNWKEVFEKDQEIVLGTTFNEEPNLNVVLSVGFFDEKLLIADCQMNTTLKNLKSNNKICVYAKKNNTYLRLKGTVEIFNSGKYFEKCKEVCDGYNPKNAILISIKEVFDLDNSKKII